MRFAMVTHEWHHEDQDIPLHKRSKIARRDGTFPPVRGISLSTDFASGDPSRYVYHQSDSTVITDTALFASHGDITIYVQASTIPGLAPVLAVPPLSSSSSIAKKMWVRSTSAHLDALHASPDLAPRRVFGRDDTKDKTSDDIPFNFTSPGFNLFNTSFDCPQNGKVPGFSGAVSVDLSGLVEGCMNFGFAYAGTPFSDDFEFALTSNFNASINATLSLTASLTVCLSRNVPLPDLTTQ